MGLMLSLLVVCVGVIEALSCFEHFQYGVLHCATNVYERARRRSSVFLKYTSRRLKLLSENSISEYEEQPEINVFQPIQFRQNSSFDSLEQFPEENLVSETESDQFVSLKKTKPIQKKPVLKKLEKEDKIQIVKNLLERPRRPKTVRSISMPELVHTEEDIELSKIINDLAIEPIEEIDDVNSGILSKEFDELFNEYENSGEHYGSRESPLHDFQDKNSEDLDRFEEKKVPLEPEGICDSGKSMNEIKNKEENFVMSENDENERNREDRNFKQEIKSDGALEKADKKSVAGVIKANISERVSDKGAAYFQETLNKKGSILKGQGSGFERSTSVDFSKVKSLMINKPVAVNLDVLSEMSNDSSELILEKSISHNKLEDIIFESDTPPVEVIDKTFDEIYENICHESMDVTNTFKEIEKNILCDEITEEAELGRQSDNQPNPIIKDETSLGLSNEKTISNAVFLKAVEQLAELLVRDSINLRKIRNLLFKNSNSLNGHEKFFSIQNNSKLGFNPESQLENETIFVEGNTTSKESVCSEKNVSDMNNIKEDESINRQEKPVSQELPSYDSLREHKTDAFSTEGKVDITDSEVVDELQKSSYSIMAKEKSNLLSTHLELGSQSTPVLSEDKQNIGILLRDDNAGIEFPANVEMPKVIDESSKSDMSFAKESLEEDFQKEIFKCLPHTGSIENIKESHSQPELNEFSKDSNAVVKLPVISETEIVPKLVIDISEGLTLTVGDAKKDLKKEILQTSFESENIKDIVETVMVLPESGNIEIVAGQSSQLSGNDNVLVEFPVVSDTKDVTKNTENSLKTDTTLTEKNAEGDFQIKIIKAFSESELIESVEEPPHQPELEKFSGDDCNYAVELPLKSNNVKLQIEIEDSLKSNMKPTEGDTTNNFEKKIIKAFYESENIKPIVESVPPEMVPPELGNIEIFEEKLQISGNENAVAELLVTNNITEILNDTKDTSKSGLNLEEIDAKEVLQKEILKTFSESENMEPVVENAFISPESKNDEVVADTLHVSGKGNAVVEFPVINEREVVPKEIDSSAHLNITGNEETIKKEIVASSSMSGKTHNESTTKLPEEVIITDSNKTVNEAEIIVEKKDFLPNEEVSDLKKLQEDKPFSIKSEPHEKDVKSEFDTSQDKISGACSDIVNENIEAVESKPLTVEHNIEGKSDVIRETKELSEMNIEKSQQKIHLRDVEQPKQTSEETVLKLPERAGVSEKNVKFEQVGTVELTLLEESQAEKTQLGMTGPVPGSAVVKGEHFGDSKNLKENKATSSEPEAFWLIFSGEYTKAMSKDWHSGHFSCWQCDEALTGQRYVLRDDHPYCIKCYESVFANVCEECNKIIGIDSKDLSYKDKHWHEACFLCNKCRVSLVDKQFGSKADKIYCGNCYDAQFASRCDGCGEIFRAGTKKMEYKTRQWHEKCFCCCVCKTPIGTKSFIPREQEIYCATCYEEKFATRCVKCNKIITSGGVTYKNEPWHRECFTCTNCNTSLAGQRFTSRDEKPYCADCFGELFAKRCTACSRPITGIGGTRFISFEDRHWHNDCFICASCKTSLVGRGFITDGDDIICPECAKQKLM